MFYLFFFFFFFFYTGGNEGHVSEFYENCCGKVGFIPSTWWLVIFWSSSMMFLTIAIFSGVLCVFFLPEFPLLRFRMVPWLLNLCTVRKIVFLSGELRSGNLLSNSLRTRGMLPVSLNFNTMNILCSVVSCMVKNLHTNNNEVTC